MRLVWIQAVLLATVGSAFGLGACGETGPGAMPAQGGSEARAGNAAQGSNAAQSGGTSGGLPAGAPASGGTAGAESAAGKGTDGGRTSAGAGSGGSAGGGKNHGNTTTCAQTVTDVLSKPSPGPLVDARDGRAYRTTQIGTLLWMAENLDHGVRVDGVAGQVDDTIVEKFCVDDCETACAMLGGLYTFAEALGLPSSCNQKTCTSVIQPHRGICPEAWHLPNLEEWALLETTVEADVGQNYAGNALRSKEGWLPAPDLGTDGNGNDAYGLRVLPTGVFSPSDNAFSWLGEVAYFWHGNDASGPVAFIRYLRSGQRNVAKGSGAKTMGFSVRCVAD